ncbi:MAG: hypothetical protein MK116_05565 [Phycisphaerales bacterium]|nr:hypothetical protein [Phycisphaerales bacterium]
MAVVATASVASADLMWDEAIDGDLSGDYLNPTQMFTKGVNNHVIFDSVSADREYWTFTIEEGYQLSAIIVDDWVSEDDLAFIAVASGSVFPTPPDAPDVTTLLGYAHFGELDLGNDILQNIGGGLGSIGFSGALGAGTYTWWAQETGPFNDHIDLNFVVTAVPGPSALALLAAGGFWSRRRRR